jgi:glucose/arabinose dehydrogenase
MHRHTYITISLLVLFLLSSCAGPSTPTTTAQPSSKPSGQPTQTQEPSRTGPQSTATVYATSSIPGLTLPPGFQMSVYASGLNVPRFITIGPKGVLLVAERGANRVIALPAGSSVKSAGKPIVIASNLNSPTSLVMYNGFLYVGEGASIARMALGDDLKAGPVQRIITDLPEGGQHSTRTVLIGPDNHIYVSIGSSCNVCIESDPHRAAIWQYNMDGSNGHLYAHGLRNAVGMAVNPWSQQIWINVNGRDLMGDNTPPETVYSLIQNADYGWPRCHAGNIIDPDFGQAGACDGVQQPLIKMQAHSAPLGMAFYPPDAKLFPQNYQSSLYIAFHGSWNRSTPTGYKVVRVPLSNGQIAGSAQDFITGWLKDNGNVSGRPVGLAFANDGSLFVSDDQGGKIYHVWYVG